MADAFKNINLTTDAGVSPAVVEYHNKALLKNVKPNQIWARDMQKIPLPAHNGRRAKFRRYNPFPVNTTPLQEGVTPLGQKLQMTEKFATITPHGDYIAVSDEMNWALIDNDQVIANELLSDQASLTMDTLARDGMCAGLNVRYAGDAANRGALTANDKLGANDIKKAVRDLKKNLAKKFSDGFYHAIIDSDTYLDLMNMDDWHDIAVYQDKGKIERGELGCMYGVKFFETQNPKVYDGNEILYKTTSDETATEVSSIALLASAPTEAKPQIKLNIANLTDFICRQLAHRLVELKSTGANEVIYIENVALDGTATLRWVPETEITASVTIVPCDKNNATEVHASVIYGQDYAGCVALEGGDNVRVIIKPVGSAGATDPLEQRGSMGWKAKGLCYTPIQDAFGVRIEHAVG